MCLYDTISLVSPYISEDLASNIEKSVAMVKKQGIALDSGEILYEITDGQLEGSFDSRLQVVIHRSEFVRPHSDGQAPVKKESKPYVQLSGSVHKAMLGHNIFGGPNCFQLAACWMVNLIERLLVGRQEILPNGLCWTVRRVDVANVYRMPNYESIESWFRAMKMSEFPRRQPQTYAGSGIYFPGSTTTLKFYHKGKEFFKRDRRRLRNWLDDGQLTEIQLLANEILRVETEVKARKLKYDFGYMPFVWEVTDQYLQKLHEREVVKVLNLAKEMPVKVRNTEAVKNRLFSNHKSNLAGALFSTWVRLSTFGEQKVKKEMAKKTFYRHKKLLREAGCDWNGSDLQIVENESYIIKGFEPLPGDSHWLNFVAPEVKEKLSQIA